MNATAQANNPLIVRDELPRLGFIKYKMSDHESCVEVTVFEGQAIRCSCGHAFCQHGVDAQQLERIYQERLRMIPDSCLSCGRMCRKVRGLALCPNCAD